MNQFKKTNENEKIEERQNKKINFFQIYYSNDYRKKDKELQLNSNLSKSPPLKKSKPVRSQKKTKKKRINKEKRIWKKRMRCKTIANFIVKSKKKGEKI